MSPRQVVVGRVGLEPTRCCHRQILSLLRLPIPPPPPVIMLYSTLSAGYVKR